MLNPPLGSILDFLNLRTYRWQKMPRATILKGLLRHIYIEKDQMKCFIFFLGWGLKVTYNLDIFEKLRPPMGFQMSEFEF